MPKLRFAILTAMIAATGIEFTPAAIAISIQTSITDSISSRSASPKATQDIRRIALNKGCKTRRYRRPH
jgi:hypothetical protein